MKITIDCDDVLADTNTATLQRYNQMFGEHRTIEEFHPIWQDWGSMMTKEQHRQLINLFFDPQFVQAIAPYPDAIRGMPLLQKEGVEMYVLTARTTRTKNETWQWVKKYFGETVKDIIFQYNENHERILEKGKFCRENQIQLHIDDNPHHVAEMKALGIPVIVVDAHWNRDVAESSSVRRAKNWVEIVQLVKEFKEGKW